MLPSSKSDLLAKSSIKNKTILSTKGIAFITAVYFRCEIPNIPRNTTTVFLNFQQVLKLLLVYAHEDRWQIPLRTHAAHVTTPRFGPDLFSTPSIVIFTIHMMVTHYKIIEPLERMSGTGKKDVSLLRSQLDELLMAVKEEPLQDNKLGLALMRQNDTTQSRFQTATLSFKKIKWIKKARRSIHQCQ